MKDSTIRIKFADFDELYKGKQVLLYDYNRDSKPLVFDGFEVTIDKKFKKRLDEKEVKYSVIK